MEVLFNNYALPPGLSHRLRKSQPLIRTSLDSRFQNLASIARFQNSEKRHHPLFWNSPKRLAVEHDPAPNRRNRRKLTNDEPISRQQQSRRAQSQACECRLSWLYPLCAMQSHFRDGFESIGMKMNACSVFDRLGRRQQTERNINLLCRLENVRGRKRRAARQILHLNAGEVQSCSFASNRLPNLLPMHLHSAHTRSLA